MERESLTAGLERRLRDGARLGLAAARAWWLAISIGVAAFAVGYFGADYFGASKLIDDDNPASGAEATVEKSVAALREGEGKTACELFTDAGRQDLLDLFEGTKFESKSCKELIATIAPDVGPLFDDAIVTTSFESETHATVLVNLVNTADDASLLTVNLVKQKKGEWRIDAVP